MASIAEMLVGSQVQRTQIEQQKKDTSLMEGAQLGLKVQQVQMQRQQLEKQKADAKQAKFQNMTADMLKARTLGGKALSGYRNFLKNKAKKLQVDDVFSDQAIDLVTSVPENLDRFEVLLSEIQSGDRSLAQGIEALQDEGIFYELDPMQRQRLADAQKTATLEANKAQRAETIAGATTARAREARSAAGEVELNKKLAKEAASFKGAGGESTLRSRIRKLDDVIKSFESGDISTGSLMQSLPVTGGDAADRVFRKKFKEAQDTVKGVIDVKKILDSQFGDKALAEVQRNLGIDGALESEQNLKRLKELKRSMMNELDTKAAEFRKRGFIDGSAPTRKAPEPKGPAKGADSFSIRGRKVPKATLIEGIKKNPNLLQQAADALGMSPEQLKSELGMAGGVSSQQ